MQIYRDVYTIGDAKRILREQGLEYAHIIGQPIPKRYPKHEFYPPIHYYFMVGRYHDLGYYTPETETLIIHNMTRQWGDEALVGYRYYS